MRLQFSSFLALAGVLCAGPAAAQVISLRLPVACEIGSTCFFLHFVARVASPAVQYYQCSTLTYAVHAGIVIWMPAMAAQRAGVVVLAPARGKVLRVPDGMEDVTIAG